MSFAEVPAGELEIVLTYSEGGRTMSFAEVPAGELEIVLTYSEGGRTMSFAEVPAGELEIDLNRQTASVDGASIMEHYVFGSDFILPHAGAMLIAGTGTVQWRERWIG